MKLEKVSERVYANCDGETGGNVGIIIMENSVAAVDAQYPVSAVEFRKGIANTTKKPVTHLLLTHIHGDHVFGNQVFEDCEIVSHLRLREKMEKNLQTVWAKGNFEKMLEDVKKNRPERAWLYEGLRIVLPSKTFENNYALNGVEMKYLGGHTDCSSVVFIPEDKVLYAGDLMFAETFPWGGDPTADPDKWIKAYETILEMDVNAIVPGHGPLCDKKEFKKQLNWFIAVRKEMCKLISDGATEEEAVYYDGYPDFYESEGERRENTLKHWYCFWSKKV